MVKRATIADEFIIVGAIGAPFGVRGWVKINAYSAALLDYDPWYIQASNNQWQPIKIQDARIQGKTIVAKFAHIHTREEAQLLTLKKLAINRLQLPALKPGEYYWVELQGLTVINQQGNILGTVTSLLATGSNDVLIVKGTKEFAIPYLPQVIQSVDLEKRQIIVDWELI